MRVADRGHGLANVVIVKSLLLVVALAVASPAGARTNVRVEWTDGLVSIIADAMPRAAVLRALSRETGVEFVGVESLADETVTLNLGRLPLVDAVRRVIGDLPVVLVEDRGPDGTLRLVYVRIFARADSPPWSGGEAEFAREIEIREGEASTSIKALLAAAHSPDTRQRLDAVRMLDGAGHVDSATAIAALDHAATDADEAIKAFAIDALTARGADGLSLLRRIFRGGNRNVRLMVLQAVSTRDGDSALLHEALTDTDAQVRGFAMSRLSNPEMAGGPHR